MKTKAKNNLQLGKRITFCFICIMISVYLLFPGFGGYGEIMQYKTYSFWALAGIYCLTMAELFIVKPTKGIKLNLTQIMIIAYMVLTWVSCLLSEYRSQSVIGMSRYEGAVTISLYCLVALFISMNAEINELVLKIFSCAVILFCILGIIQFTGLNPLELFPEGYSYLDANKAYYGQYLSTIGNVDLVSAFICPAAAMLLVASYRLKGKIRLFTIPAAALAIFVLIKIYVKSGFLGLGCGLVLALPFILDVSDKTRKRLIFSIAVLIILALIIIFIFDPGSGMFHELHQILHGNINLNFGTGRLKIWSEVLSRVPEAPIFGHGPDTMLASDIEPWSDYLEAYEQEFVSYIDVAHNEYLNVLYHQGILGMLAFIGIIASVFINILRNKRFNDKTILLSVFLLCYCIQALFTMSMCMTAIYFWIAVGLLNSSK